MKAILTSLVFVMLLITATIGNDRFQTRQDILGDEPIPTDCFMVFNDNCKCKCLNMM